MRVTVTLVFFGWALSSCGGECGDRENYLECNTIQPVAPTLILDETPVTPLSTTFGFGCAEPDHYSGACLTKESPNGYVSLYFAIDNPAYGDSSVACPHGLSIVVTIPPGKTLTPGTILPALEASAAFSRAISGQEFCVGFQERWEYRTLSATVTVLPRTEQAWNFAVDADLERTYPPPTWVLEVISEPQRLRAPTLGVIVDKCSRSRRTAEKWTADF